jgi:hypothetical protein
VSPRAYTGQNENFTLESIQVESKSASLELPDSGSETGNGMSRLGTMIEESGTNGAFMDLDETTQLSSYAQFQPHGILLLQMLTVLKV